jgi:hypothetical protein
VLKKQLLVGVALSVLNAGLAGGCASDKELSKDEYVSRLNAMCEDFSAREQEIGEPHTLADLVEKGPRILDAFEMAIMRKLTLSRLRTRLPLRRTAWSISLKSRGTCSAN